MKTIKGLIMSIQFFTSIPISYEVPMDRVHIEKAIKTFPLLGLCKEYFIPFSCMGSFNGHHFLRLLWLSLFGWH